MRPEKKLNSFLMKAVGFLQSLSIWSVFHLSFIARQRSVIDKDNERNVERLFTFLRPVASINPKYRRFFTPAAESLYVYNRSVKVH